MNGVPAGMHAGYNDSICLAGAASAPLRCMYGLINLALDFRTPIMASLRMAVVFPDVIYHVPTGNVRYFRTPIMASLRVMLEQYCFSAAATIHSPFPIPNSPLMINAFPRPMIYGARKWNRWKTVSEKKRRAFAL